jgi:hypothetical protein
VAITSNLQQGIDLNWAEDMAGGSKGVRPPLSLNRRALSEDEGMMGLGSSSGCSGVTGNSSVVGNGNGNGNGNSGYSCQSFCSTKDGLVSELYYFY